MYVITYIYFTFTENSCESRLAVADKSVWLFNTSTTIYTKIICAECANFLVTMSTRLLWRTHAYVTVHLK